ncbi:MmpS family transport accessory protein [Mycolicibacterium sp. HK-90]|uniref:MmpS family transport accessory protein n=1 Tax=Mycolicibacterium sp. HK-90 TaxID=3056937 RepID=UPI00265975ED|nr:MmpS family transport accessory protein [Mycolicibacterium sp. HK-90]WKG05260.1 MmpS family transport accessory protein [Mycolicibacterium sp. HK-90]
MTRHYSPYDTTPTERFGDHPYEPGGYAGYTPDYKTDYRSDYPADPDAEYDADYDDEVVFYEDPIDRRWIWVAAVAGAILLVAVICTVVILGGGDSGSVSATLTSPAAPTQTTQPAQDATSRPAAPPRATAPLSPETVTTVTPAPSATAAPEPAAPPAVAAPPAPNANPNAVTYQVTGNRQLIDLVTIVYTDAQGALQTEFNVALPWTKMVVLNPGVTLKSVTATSVAGQLNCTITDASGAVLVSQANNSMITTCTQ